jgi:hypothetical protein
VRVAHFTITDDEVSIGSLRLRTPPQESKWQEWREGGEGLLLDKARPLLEELDEVFTARDFRAERIIELGIWDGGSSAFWFEYFQPEKLVAVDRLDRGDADAFRRYVEAKDAVSRLRTFWGIDQADRNRLAQLVADEFDFPLDLVIDDASHELHATRASFETLFPLLRSGGLYLIEDWNWEIYPTFHQQDHPFAGREGLVSLVKELVDMAARGEVRLTISQLLVTVERP